MEQETVARHLVVTGRVQGVAFRASMVAEAQRLGVGGWVRNCRDGSVEAVAQGTAEQVQALLAWARHGPRHAKVLGLEIREVALQPTAAFELRATV